MKQKQKELWHKAHVQAVLGLWHFFELERMKSFGNHSL